MMIMVFSVFVKGGIVFSMIFFDFDRLVNICKRKNGP